MTNPVPSSLGLSPAEVLTVVEAAARAPSVHNSQPWRFRVLPNRIELHADLTRRLPGTDSDDKELRLACGAALANLRIALEALGIRPLVSLLPGKGDALAVVRYGGHMTPSPELSALRHAIDGRRTNRKPFRDVPVPATYCGALQKAAQVDRAWLHVVSDPMQGARLRSLVTRAHHAQLDNPSFRAELDRWTGHNDGRADGVPTASAGPAPEPQDEWVLRDYAGGHGRQRITGKDYEGRPLLLIVCSYYDSKLAELQAGQALQRVLLTATTLGLSASFLSQPIEVPAFREDLRRLLGTGVFPQAILRVGFGSAVPATPRRPVADLLMHDSPAIAGGA